MEGMQEHARALADGIESALPAWVERSVRARLGSASRLDAGQLEDAIAAAAGTAALETGGQVRSLLEADIDDQHTTPLALVRQAVRYPTEVLRAAGAPPVERDAVQAGLLPDDPYDLAPATFADVDPGLADLGLAWGAAKAFAHLRRHRPAGAGRSGSER